MDKLRDDTTGLVLGQRSFLADAIVLDGALVAFELAVGLRAPKLQSEFLRLFLRHMLLQQLGDDFVLLRERGFELRHLAVGH